MRAVLSTATCNRYEENGPLRERVTGNVRRATRNENTRAPIERAFQTNARLRDSLRLRRSQVATWFGDCFYCIPSQGKTSHPSTSRRDFDRAYPFFKRNPARRDLAGDSDLSGNAAFIPSREIVGNIAGRVMIKPRSANSRVYRAE